MNVMQDKRNPAHIKIRSASLYFGGKSQDLPQSRQSCWSIGHSEYRGQVNLQQGGGIYSEANRAICNSAGIPRDLNYRYEISVYR
jgi:hypothetical protein